MIQNLESGEEVNFVKKDGVYVFEMWVAPVEMAAATFVRQP